MRSFIAVEARTPGVEGLLSGLSSLGAALRVVKPEGLHITMKFLGEIPEGRVGEIYSAMEEAFSPFEPFHISLKGAGAFPSPRRPRVVWVGVEEGRDTLIRMQSALDSNLSSLGFQKEKRRFHPHLTLARVKTPRVMDRLQEFIEGHKGEEFGRVAVGKVELKKSLLTPRGALYTTLRASVL
jgi:2'-5' RNA ligase